MVLKPPALTPAPVPAPAPVTGGLFKRAAAALAGGHIPQAQAHPTAALAKPGLAPQIAMAAHSYTARFAELRDALLRAPQQGTWPLLQEVLDLVAEAINFSAEHVGTDWQARQGLPTQFLSDALKLVAARLNTQSPETVEALLTQRPACLKHLTPEADPRQYAGIISAAAQVINQTVIAAKKPSARKSKEIAAQDFDINLDDILGPAPKPPKLQRIQPAIDAALAGVDADGDDDDLEEDAEAEPAALDLTPSKRKNAQDDFDMDLDAIMKDLL